MTSAIREIERCGHDSGIYFVGEKMNDCVKWQWGNIQVSHKSRGFCLMDRISLRMNIDNPVSCSLAMKYFLDNPKSVALIMSVGGRR